MADWSPIASLATAGGTLVLAAATFSSVRFGQRSARIAERSTAIAERALLRVQARDLYVPAGDTGFWQGAIREPGDPFREGLDEAFSAGRLMTVDLLYGDHEGGQLSISRFVLTREEDGQWRPGVVRHWVLEGVDPRERQSPPSA